MKKFEINDNFLTSFVALCQLLSKRQQRLLIILSLVAILTSIFEFLSIGALLPFLTIIISPATLSEIKFLPTYFIDYALKDIVTSQMILTFIFCASVIFSGLLKFCLIFLSAKMTKSFGVRVSSSVFSNILYTPYQQKLGTNSSEYITSLTRKIDQTSNVFTQYLTFGANVLLSLVACAALLVLNWQMTISIILLTFIFYFVASKYTGNLLKKNSAAVVEQSNKLVKICKEAFEAQKEVEVGAHQQFFLHGYVEEEMVLRQRLAQNLIAASTPKIFIETFFVLICAIGSLIAIQSLEISSVIPLLASFVFAFQRTFPRIQQLHQCWSAYFSNYRAVSDIHGLAQTQLLYKLSPSNQKVNISTTEELIKLEKLWFKKSS